MRISISINIQENKQISKCVRKKCLVVMTQHCGSYFPSELCVTELSHTSGTQFSLFFPDWGICSANLLDDLINLIENVV